MQHLIMIVSHPLRIVRELREACSSPRNSRTASGPFAILSNLEYLIALARYCSAVNIGEPSLPHPLPISVGLMTVWGPYKIAHKSPLWR